jgi:uncharacterized protein YycO
VRRALVVAAAALLLAAAPASARVPCRGHGSQTIAATRTARLFTAADGNDYACLYSAGRAYYLSTDEHYQYEHIHFAGRYVAFVQNVEATDDHVGVMDMRSGRTHNYEIATPIDNQVCFDVGSLVLKADGAVAWIGTNFDSDFCENPPAPEIEVRSHDRRGLIVWDRGTSVAAGSLRLRGSQMSWRDGAATLSATLD